VWGVLSVALVAVGVATDFIAMAAIFPWLGHASRHACRGLVERE